MLSSKAGFLDVVHFLKKPIELFALSFDDQPYLYPLEDIDFG